MTCIWIMPTVSIKTMRRPHKNVEELIAFLGMIRIWDGEEPLGHGWAFRDHADEAASPGTEKDVTPFCLY